MNESRCKLLLDYIGDCPCYDYVSMEECKNDYGYCRTLTTWDDFGKVVEVLQEKGDWEGFCLWLVEQQECGNTVPPFGTIVFMPDAIAWLMNPTRFCDLVGQWLEGKGE